jgi:Spy/CpxP family protein refolding chaperone
MRRTLVIALALLVPTVLLAQGRGGDETGMLKGFGLDDAQVAQVTAIEKSTREALRADFTHIGLIRAQIAEALLPAAPDEQTINALIDKKGQLRIDIDKNLMSARIQLVKIMGEENFAKFARFAMRRMPSRFGERPPMGPFGMGPGSMPPEPMRGEGDGNE